MKLKSGIRAGDGTGIDPHGAPPPGPDDNP
jgi:hypothetical protein